MEPRITVVQDVTLAVNEPFEVWLLRGQVFHDVAKERAHQLIGKKWTAEADDEHERGELAFAAAAYCLTSAAHGDPCEAPMMADARIAWPFRKQEFKPKDQRRDLVRAAALIIAEIQRIDRAAAKAVKA